MLNYTVGYQLRSDSNWIDCILSHKDRISEVFFAPFDMPNGRTGEWVVRNEHSISEQCDLQRQDLKRLAAEGIPLNVLFNAGCYGKHARSSKLLDSVIERVDSYRSELGLHSVTTTSPFVAEAIRTNLPGVLVRASINMDISSAQAMDYIAPCFDGYYLKREYNRDFKTIRRVRKWCNDNGKQLLMLANSGCLNDCSIHIFHNNLVAHAAELEDVDKRYPLRGCRDYLLRPGKLVSLIRDTNWVRPEDISLYDGLFDSVKLATRVNPHPERILEAYVAEHYEGSILDLTEPDHSVPMNGAVLDNSRIPVGFGSRVGNCERNCETCGYCESVFSMAYVASGGGK